MLSPAILAPLLAAAAAFAIGVCPTWDYDVWFQLACGRAIVGMRGLPVYDLFSFSATDQPWDTQEWLTQVIFYLVARTGGIPALTLLKAALAAALFFVTARHAVRRGADPWLAAGLCGVAAFILRWFIVERPAIFTMLFLAIQLSALQTGRRIFWLVPLSLLWANLHGGSSLLGPAVTALWLAGLAIEALRRKEPLSSLKGTALVMLGQAAVILANPAGPGLFTYPFKTVGDQTYMQMVREWLPPTLSEFPGFFLFLAALAAIFALTARSWRLPDIFLCAATGALALSARRHIPLLCLCAVPPLARAVSDLLSHPLPRSGRGEGEGSVDSGASPNSSLTLDALDSLSRGTGEGVFGKYSAMIRPAIGLAALVLPVAWLVPRGEALRMGVQSKLYPAGSVRRLTEILPPGREPLRVFTLHRWGGWLEWNLPADCRVFIDGRQLVFGPGLFRDYYNILENTEVAGELLGEWKPDAFILDYGSLLGKRFALSREAALVWWDDNSLLFLARNRRNAAAIRKPEYRALNPESGPTGSLAAAVAEARRAVREAPQDVRPRTILSRLLLSAGDAIGAAEAAREALEISPRSAPALLAAAGAATARRDLAGAALFLRRARAADPATTAPRLAEARLASVEGDNRKALALAADAVRAGEEWWKRRGRPEPALVEAYSAKAALEGAAGDRPAAADSLRRAGNVVNDLGEPARALEFYRRALELTPGDYRLHHNTGAILLTMGKYAKAVLSFRRALETNPRSADSFAGLGVAYWRMKLLPLAREAWKKALEIDPRNPDAREYLERTSK